VNKPVVVNLIGGPGTGKSVLAADIFSVMKKAGTRVELAAEWIKAPVYEGRLSVIEDQLYVLAKQHRNISRVVDQVDYIVCDSPLLLCPIYAKPGYYPLFKELTFDVWGQYRNLTFYVERPENWEYHTEGRYQSAIDEAKAVDAKILDFLNGNGVPYRTVNPAKQTIDFNWVRENIIHPRFKYWPESTLTPCPTCHLRADCAC
jgi:hypothetical protein